MWLIVYLVTLGFQLFYAFCFSSVIFSILFVFGLHVIMSWVVCYVRLLAVDLLVVCIVLS